MADYKLEIYFDSIQKTYAFPLEQLNNSTNFALKTKDNHCDLFRILHKWCQENSLKTEQQYRDELSFLKGEKNLNLSFRNLETLNVQESSILCRQSHPLENSNIYSNDTCNSSQEKDKSSLIFNLESSDGKELFRSDSAKGSPAFYQSGPVKGNIITNSGRILVNSNSMVSPKESLHPISQFSKNNKQPGFVIDSSKMTHHSPYQQQPINSVSRFSINHDNNTSQWIQPKQSQSSII